MPAKTSSKFSEAALNAIKPGMSQAAVVDLVGKPLHVVPAPNSKGELFICAASGVEPMSYRIGHDCRILIEKGVVVWAELFNIETGVHCRCEKDRCEPTWARACFRSAARSPAP
jgi:hypothetical protein